MEKKKYRICGWWKSTYLQCERCGPHSRGYVEINLNQIMECARKKNLLWVLVRIHTIEKQIVLSWTGFNILVRNDQEVTKDNVGYLATISAPATNMSTVGVFHTICMFLSVIGKRYQDAGLRDAINESDQMKQVK